jgi:hypothetical protein
LSEGDRRAAAGCDLRACRRVASRAIEELTKRASVPDYLWVWACGARCRQLPSSSGPMATRERNRADQHRERACAVRFQAHVGPGVQPNNSRCLRHSRKKRHVGWGGAPLSVATPVLSSYIIVGRQAVAVDCAPRDLRS